MALVPSHIPVNEEIPTKPPLLRSLRCHEISTLLGISMGVIDEQPFGDRISHENNGLLYSVSYGGRVWKFRVIPRGTHFDLITFSPNGGPGHCQTYETRDFLQAITKQENEADDL